MKLAVYSLKKVLFEGQARLLNCKTALGEITILDNHETFIGVIKPGVARIVDDHNQEHFFPVSSGFLEVRRGNEVRCLVD